MTWPKGFKLVWWFLLVAALTYVMARRSAAITTGQATSVDAVFFLVWVALLLSPLFQEISVFGLKLKQRFEELKAHVDKSIQTLKMDIENRIDVRTQFSPQLYLNAPPPADTQLPQIEESVRRAVEEALRTRGISMPVGEEPEPRVPREVQYLFAVRHSLEKTLRDAYAARFGPPETRRPPTVVQLAKALAEAELISPNLVSAIREVYSVCSPAIHGQEVSQAQVQFVRDVAPQLIAAVRAIE